MENWLERFLKQQGVPGVKPDASAVKPKSSGLRNNMPAPPTTAIRAGKGPVREMSGRQKAGARIADVLEGRAGGGMFAEMANPILSAARAGHQTAKALSEDNPLLAGFTAAMALAGKPGKPPKDVIEALGQRWAVLTAENPGGQAAKKAVNDRAMRALDEYLSSHAIEARPGAGVYVDGETLETLKERVRVLKDIDPTYAEKIGRMFGQNSVLTPAGLHNLGEGAVTPAVRVAEAPAGAPIYTQLQGGKRFAADLDFNQSVPAPAPKPLGAPAIHVNDDWKPVERGVFPRDKGDAEYREIAPLPFETKISPRAGISPVAARVGDDPSIEAGLRADVEQGLKLGGRSWYGTKALKEFIEGTPGAASFKEFNAATAAGSLQTPTHNELLHGSLMLYAKKHGVGYDEALREFQRRFPNAPGTLYSSSHYNLFDRALRNDATLTPSSPTSGNLKIPNYAHDRNLGATGIALDTHELRRLSQFLGMDEDDLIKQVKANAGSYNAATEPYRRIADQMGLFPDQVQASRWLGGATRTNMKSQPRGDFLQTVEDGLLYTARQRGMDESPRALRGLFAEILRGDDFFLPTSATGGFPVY